MSTRSIVGSAETQIGVYVHDDGYPTSILIDIANIVKRDGVSEFLNKLMQHEWSSIDITTSKETRHQYTPDHVIEEDGFGKYYKDDADPKTFARPLTDEIFGYGIYPDGKVDVYYRDQKFEADLFDTNLKERAVAIEQEIGYR